MKRFVLQVLVVSTLFILFLTSCKDPLPPKAVVTVYLDGYTVEGVVVTAIPGDPNQTNFLENMQDVKVTNESGQTFHEFGYEGILTIIAKKTDVVLDSGQIVTKYYEGRSVLVLENDKTIDKEVTLKPYN